MALLSPRILASLWTLLIFVALSLPGSSLPDASLLEYDKAAHFVLFFILTSALDHGVRPLAHRTVFFWPILGILIVLIAVFVVQMIRLSDPSNLRRLRDSLATPLFLGAASLVVGVAGTGIELYRSLMRMVADPEHAAPIFSRAALGTTATLSIALLVALAAGVAWFYLAGRVARIEDRAAETFKEVG